MKPFLKSCGFTVRTEVKIIPISALTGDNVKKQVEPAVCPWWGDMVKEGANNTADGTLLKLLDKISMEGRDPDKPLLIPVGESLDCSQLAR